MSISTPLARSLGIALASNSLGEEMSAILNGSQSGASTFTGGVTITTTALMITDVDIVLSATTGTKIGTATTQKLGFFNAAPVAQRSAYTQTAYATATRTVANVTGTSVVTTAAGLASYGYTEAQANAIVAAINALVVDVANVKQALNSVIDDLQSLGFAG